MNEFDSRHWINSWNWFELISGLLDWLISSNLLKFLILKAEVIHSIINQSSTINQLTVWRETWLIGLINWMNSAFSLLPQLFFLRFKLAALIPFQFICWFELISFAVMNWRQWINQTPTTNNWNWELGKPEGAAGSNKQSSQSIH